MKTEEFNREKTIADLESLLVAVGSAKMRVETKNRIIKMILEEIKFYEQEEEK